jgi:hypothetical protein
VVIRDHWPMHVALIPLFAVRGAWLLLPLLGGVVIVALRRRAWPVLAFVSPMLFSIFFHAAITHYLARYSVPLVPCAMIVLAWWVRPAREPLAEQAGGSASAQPPSLEGGSSLEQERA